MFVKPLRKLRSFLSKASASEGPRGRTTLKLEQLEVRRLMTIDFASEALAYLRSQSLLSDAGSSNATLIADLAIGAPSYSSDGAFTTESVTVGSTTTQISSQQLTAFQRVWQSLSSDEVLDVLLDNGVISGYTDLSSLQGALTTRGVDLSNLRPDGILTALAIAPDPAVSGSHNYAPLLTTSDGLAARNELLANFVAAPYDFLNSLSESTIVGLLNNTFVHNSSTTSTPFVYPSVDLRDFAGHVTTVPADIAGIIELYPPGQWTNNAADGATRSNAMGTGKPVVIYDHGFEYLNSANWPSGGYSSTIYQGSFLGGGGVIDKGSTQISGSPYAGQSSSSFALIWMDTWASDVATNLNTWLTAYETAGGAQISKWIMDFEDNGLRYAAINQSTGRVPTVSGATIWDAIINDSRWTATGGVRDQLIQAGMPQNFDQKLISGVANPNWIGSWGVYDPKVMIWDNVMQQRYDSYLQTAILAPIHSHQGSGKAFASSVDVTNYDSYQHAQTVHLFLPDYIPSDYGSVGTVFGDGTGTNGIPSAHLYGSNSAISTTDQTALLIPASYDPSRTGTTRDYPGVGPYNIINHIDYSAINSTSGTVTIHLNSKVYGLAPGDKIRIKDHPSVATLPAAYTSNDLIITAVDNDGDHSGSSDDPTITASLTFSGTAPTSVSSVNVWVNLDAYWKPFNAFMGDVLTLRSQAAASPERFEDWIADQDFLYTEWPMGLGTSPSQNGGIFEYYDETVFQGLMSGAADFLWYHGDAGDSAKQTANQTNADKLHGLMAEAESFTGNTGKSIVEATDRKTVSFDEPSASAGFVLTGIEGDGKRLWRLTVDDVSIKPGTSSRNITVTDNSDSTNVHLRITNQSDSTYRDITIPHAHIQTVSSPQSTHGYWIVQDSADSPISSASSALTALANAIKPIVSESTTTVDTTVTLSLGMDSSLFGSGDQFDYTIIWDGDATHPETVTGYRSGSTVNHNFSPGTHSAVVSAVESGDDREFGSTTISIDLTRPGLGGSVSPASTTINTTSPTITIPFNEAVTGVGAGDVQLSGTGVDGSTSIGTPYKDTGTNTWHWPVTGLVAGASKHIVVYVPLTGITDLAGNPLQYDYGWSFDLDTVQPTVSSAPAINGTTTNSTSATVTMTFSEAVSGLSASSLVLTGSGVNGSTSVGTPTNDSGTNTWHWAVTGLVGGANQTVNVALGSSAAHDGAGNTLDANYNWSFTVDTVNPTVSSPPAIDGTRINTTSTTITMTFSEAVSGLSSSSLVLTGTGVNGSTSVGTPTNDSGTNTWHWGVTGLVSGANNAVNVALASSAAHDAAGNALNTSYSWNFNVDTVKPGLGGPVSPASTTITSTSTIITMTFDEAVTGVSASDLHLSGTGVDVSTTIGTPYNDSGTNTWHWAVSNLVSGPSKTVTVYVPYTGITDLAGNELQFDYGWSFTVST